MNNTVSALQELYNRIPRRHTSDNVKEMYGIIDEYEALLQGIEAESPSYEQLVATYFDTIEPVRVTIKKSNDNKASKKNKDNLFDEASGLLKDSVTELMAAYTNAVKAEPK
jgi:hypothetical protein